MSVTAAAGVAVTLPNGILPPLTVRYRRLQHPALITMVTAPLFPPALLTGHARQQFDLQRCYVCWYENRKEMDWCGRLLSSHCCQALSAVSMSRTDRGKYLHQPGNQILPFTGKAK
ncbi:hypothetical protein AOLI_G00060420 [Acnodon oligacanthus]